MNSTIYTSLLEQVQEIEIVDTHEHILRREDVQHDPLHLDMESAVEIARALFYDNPSKLFNLSQMNGHLKTGLAHNLPR